jgi:hypothetical protein
MHGAYNVKKMKESLNKRHTQFLGEIAVTNNIDSKLLQPSP